MNEVIAINNLPNKYLACSVKIANISKSSIFYSSNVSSNIKNQIQDIM